MFEFTRAGALHLLETGQIEEFNRRMEEWRKIYPCNQFDLTGVDWSLMPPSTIRADFSQCDCGPRSQATREEAEIRFQMFARHKSASTPPSPIRWDTPSTPDDNQ